MLACPFAVTVAAMLASVVSSVTFTAEFEKTLTAQLASLKQDLEAYPDLVAVVAGVPQDVAEWKALSFEETVTKLRLFSDQKADELPVLYAMDRDNSATLTKFANDGHELVMQISEFLALDDGEDASSGAGPIAAPAAAPPASGATPATGGAASSTPPVSAPASASTSTSVAPVTGPASAASTVTTIISVPATSTVTTTLSLPAASSTASASADTTTAFASSPSSGVTVSVINGGNTAATISSSTFVRSADASADIPLPVSTTGTNVAAASLSLSTTNLFLDTNSTDSSGSDGSEATATMPASDDVGGNQSTAASSDTVTRSAESIAPRSLLSTLLATTVAVIVYVVL